MNGTSTATDGARTAQTELGVEKRCHRCGDWWPADREFFYRDSKRPDGLFSACIACTDDITRNSARRLKASKQ